jgi:hypothetical protein
MLAVFSVLVELIPHFLHFGFKVTLTVALQSASFIVVVDPFQELDLLRDPLLLFRLLLELSDCLLPLALAFALLLLLLLHHMGQPLTLARQNRTLVCFEVQRGFQSPNAIAELLDSRLVALHGFEASVSDVVPLCEGCALSFLALIAISIIAPLLPLLFNLQYGSGEAGKEVFILCPWPFSSRAR